MKRSFNYSSARCLGFAALFFLGTLSFTAAQETAQQYFEKISARYGEILDYQATLTIAKGNVLQVAALQYKSPHLLRLDFSEPQGMVMAMDGELLQIYVPQYRVTFSQPLKRRSESSLAALANAKGLDLLKRNYTIAYLSGPAPVLLDSDSSERVVKLKLNWKSSQEGFREMELSINNDLLIRRIKGVSTTKEVQVFDFTDYVINQGIPDTRFVYDSPPEGNTINNFLFGSEGAP